MMMIFSSPINLNYWNPTGFLIRDQFSNFAKRDIHRNRNYIVSTGMKYYQGQGLHKIIFLIMKRSIKW